MSGNISQFDTNGVFPNQNLDVSYFIPAFCILFND